MKIFIVREPLYFKNAKGGIAFHCESLYKLFLNDSEINILPIKDYYGCYVFGIHKPSLIQLIRDIKSSNCDVVHIHGYTSFDTTFGFIAATVCRKKIVYTAHYHPFNTRNKKLLGKLFYYLLIYPFLFFSQEIVTLNNEDSNFFKRFRRKITCIPHWKNELSEVRDKITKVQNLVLFIGGVNTFNKGFHHLSHLPKGKYDVHCVGNGIIHDSNIVQHIDISREELIRLYQKASLLVVPSKYEAFSLVALEALVYGTPVVMSDQVRIADHLNGCRGYKIFKYGDYSDFCNAVESTIGTPVDSQKIYSIFSPQAAKQKYKEIYTACMYPKTSIK